MKLYIYNDVLKEGFIINNIEYYVKHEVKTDVYYYDNNILSKITFYNHVFLISEYREDVSNIISKEHNNLTIQEFIKQLNNDSNN